MARKRHVNEFMRVFSGRIAGNGMDEEDYSEESFPRDSPWKDTKRTATWIPPYKEIKKAKFKEPPVRKYKLSDEELKKYKEEAE